ncbi:MAG: galactosyltransferase-related protein [Atribacterota bacterium]|nr:galactosyltransferase-related protein [Atribacterota bacterium]
MNIFEDLTIIIPFYEDIPERLINLRDLTSLLDDYGLKVIIVQPNTINNSSFTFNLLDRYVNILAEDIKEPFFNKSRAINEGVKHCKTKYCGWHDVDFRLNYEAYEQTFNALYNGDFSNQRIGSYFVRPFSGLFLNVKGYRFDGKLTGEQIFYEEYHKDSPGGALFFNRQNFIEIGGMNENFCGWGYEDDEIRCRILKYGYHIHSLTFTGFHINHPRHSLHSDIHPQTIKNRSELDKVKGMTLDELKGYNFSMFAK